MKTKIIRSAVVLFGLLFAVNVWAQVCPQQDQFYDPEQGQCVTDPTSVANSNCSFGYFYDPEQGECVQNPATGDFTASNPPTGEFNPGGGVYIPGSEIGLPAPSGGVQSILTNLLRWLLGIIGVIAIIGFVISGIQYILASGNEDMIDTAKRNMLYSIIGITVALASFVVIQAINYALNAYSTF